MNRFSTNCRFTGYLNVALLPLLILFMVLGCSSSGGDGSGSPAGTVDNSVFYGTYDVTLRIGECAEETMSVTVGNDQSRDGEDGYVYVPEDTNSVTFTSDGEDVTVTVSGNTVTVERAEGTWTFDIEIDFSDDYSSVTITGTASGDDECNGTIEGSGTKISDDGGSGDETTDVSGVWNLRVYNIDSSCGTEAEWNSTATIIQIGNDLTVSGSKKGEFYSVSGEVDGSTVTISGDFSEEGGTTNSTFSMTIISDGYMTGSESWTWSDGSESCTGGTADVTMTKQ